MNKWIINSEAVDQAVENFRLGGAELFGTTPSNWTKLGYELHMELGEQWTALGFKEGTDYSLAASVGRAASVTMSMHSFEIAGTASLEEAEKFLARYPKIMIIIYGDIEADDPEHDERFTIVLSEEVRCAYFSGVICPTRFGLTG